MRRPALTLALCLALSLVHRSDVAAASPAGGDATAAECGAASPGPSGRGWERVPLADGECALGTPYALFHRAGRDPSRLLVWFQGGGACWDWVSCSGLFDASVGHDELGGYRGVFDFENPDNPFREFTVVLVPYCTGDLHVGDAVRRYGDDPGARPVHHHGARNVAAVLRWVEENVAPPRQVVVAGASAGAYGALFHAPAVARLFPSADLVLIEDSGVPLLNGYPQILDGWGAAPVLRALRGGGDAAGDLTLEGAHAHAAEAMPGAPLARITSDRDAIQSAFYTISGSFRWREDAYALLDAVEAELPAARSFVVAGSDHGLLRTDAFYAYEADGVRLRDWVAKLVDGAPVESRRCSACRPD